MKLLVITIFLFKTNKVLINELRKSTLKYLGSSIFQTRVCPYNRYLDATEEIALYISFRKGNEWKTPRKLDNINSDNAWELTPFPTPDGKYFLFELNNNIMKNDLAFLIYNEELNGVGKR